MKNNILLTLILLFISVVSFSQSLKLVGKIIDEKNIHDTICSNMIKMADKLKDNMDEKFLIPFIKFVCFNFN